MAITPLKVLLFLAGGATAATGTAYVAGALDPLIARFSGGEAVALATLPDPTAPKGERLGEDPPAVAPAPEAKVPDPAPMQADPGAGAAVDAPPAAEAPAGPLLPSFDIVRVEPDGSLVIAGKAVANALVELLSAGTPIGNSKANAEGDFVIVLDQPLKPGDYQMVLRSTVDGGAETLSQQTATISVPESQDGQVLAMVEQPGKPSELMAVPQPEKPADQAAKPADEPAPAVAAAAPSADEQVPAPAADPAAGAEAKPADAAPAEPKPAGSEVAVATPETTKPADAAPPAAATVVVEAVEIEGSRIFVAGAAEAGRTVRVYADDILLGQAKASPSGRFLVEAERDLAVGTYVIRADVLGADGASVVARAAVPFEREPGETIAAVAPPASAETSAQTPPAGDQAAATPPVAEEAAPVETQDAAAAEAGSQPAAEPAAAPAGQDAAPATAQPATMAEAATPPANDNVQAGSAENDAAGGQPPSAEGQVAAAEPPAASPASPEVVAGGAPEALSPKLQSVKSAVIIRRGDSLWRISRRVYGRGIRYSTIYLANQPQIADPSRIFPGQVFKVPDRTDEGEAADMSAVGAQATTVDTQ